MSIESELKDLVSIYAKFDEKTNSYQSSLDKEKLLSLDSNFHKLMNKLLLQCDDGKEGVGAANDENITKNYRALAILLHPDKAPFFSGELKWIEHNLSEGKNDGTCFKTLTECYEKLTNPEKFKEANFNNITTRQQFKEWLEKNRDSAPSYTMRSLYTSLLGLLEQAGNYYDDVGQINAKGLRLLVGMLPLIFITYGAVILAPELCAIYGLYLIAYKSGQRLEAKDTEEMMLLGKTLKDAGAITATVTTTILVRLLELTFWLSRQCYDKSLMIGSAILTPLLPGPKTKKISSKQVPEPSAESFSKEIILASKNMEGGKQFITPELKIIAAPIEKYLGINKEQYMASIRPGMFKRNLVEAFLFRLTVIDQYHTSKEEKIAAAQEALMKIKKEGAAYVAGSKTAKAVDIAEEVIEFLNEAPSEGQLVIYGQ